MARATEQDRVRELQRPLYRAAKADPKRRFHALFDKVSRRDVLERAWGQVRANKGAAGIDRITLAEVERYGVSRLLDELAAELRAGGGGLGAGAGADLRGRHARVLVRLPAAALDARCPAGAR